MSSRQDQFSGEEAPPEHLALDLDRLGTWLSSRLPNMASNLVATKFRGGQSNPTYKLSGPGGTYVLRRKPPGKLVASAHRIDREYRILEWLAPTDVPTPRTHLYCDDESIIGSPFYIVDFIAGRVFWEADMEGTSPAYRSAVYDDMNSILASIHSLDPASVAIADIDRASNYASRNLALWSKLYQEAQVESVPDMDWLIKTLPLHLPPNKEIRFIHGDYGLYNLIVHPDEPRVVAVLDWEMATLGDPLIDLAHHLRAWWDLPESGLAATSLVGLNLPALGIPTMDDYVRLYCARRRMAVPDMRWYFAYVQFRYAAMVQGILKRAADGTASSRIMVHSQDRVTRIAAMACRSLESSLTS